MLINFLKNMSNKYPLTTSSYKRGIFMVYEYKIQELNSYGVNYDWFSFSMWSKYSTLTSLLVRKIFYVF